MSREKFVNRHGHRMRVDVNPGAAITEQKPPKVTAVKKQGQPRSAHTLPRLRISNRVILPFVMLVIVGVITMIVTADSVKRGYERQTAVMKRSVIDRGKQSASSETVAEEIINDLRGSLHAPTSCLSSGLDVVSWYGPARNARETCQTTAATYQKLQRSIEDMLAAAEYLKHISTLFSDAVSAPSSGGFGGINEYSDAWDDAVTGLGAVTPPESLRLAHQSLTSKATAVRDAWAALRDANSSQDAGAFRAAETRLNEQYTAFRGTADGIQRIISSLQSSVLLYTKQLSS